MMTVACVYSQELKQLLQTTVHVGLRFCPLEYIRVMSRQLDREISGCHLIKPLCIIPDNYLVTTVDIFCLQDS